MSLRTDNVFHQLEHSAISPGPPFPRDVLQLAHVTRAAPTASDAFAMLSGKGPLESQRKRLLTMLSNHTYADLSHHALAYLRHQL